MLIVFGSDYLIINLLGWIVGIIWKVCLLFVFFEVNSLKVLWLDYVCSLSIGLCDLL